MSALALAGLGTRSEAPAAGAVYYVAGSGDDDDPGTESLPWRTIGKAAATLAAGDTVYVRAGTYRERVVPGNSGSAGSPVTYAVYPGETATIDGAGVDIPEWGGLFDITGRSFIRVSGLRVVNARSNPHNPGILADTSDHVVIEGNYVENTNDSGIAVWNSAVVTVDHNEVVRPCQAGWNEGISVGNTDGFDVGNNVVHDTEKEGITTKDGSRNGRVFGNVVHHTVAVGFYVDASDEHTWNIEVFGNVAHDIEEDGFAVASEVGGLLENVSIHDNVAYDNGWNGLDVTRCCTSSHPVTNLEIVNNTFVGNGLSGWGGGIVLDNPQAQGVVIRNNLVSQNRTFQILISPDVASTRWTADHNLVDGFRGEAGETRGDDFVEGEPGFVDAPGADFHLLPDSPAIGQGSPDGAADADFEGYPRGSPPDIGAYEHRDGSGCTLLCIATVPAGAEIDEDVAFSATATPGGACAGGVGYDWDFGDGSAHAATADASHAYASEGTYAWKLVATVDTVSRTRTGSIVIRPPVAPPVIANVSQVGRRFRLRIDGSNFQKGLRVFLGDDGTPWSGKPRKRGTQIALRAGRGFEALFPVGQPVPIRVVNPDGGEVTVSFTR